jgi:hypothetical protein
MEVITLSTKRRVKNQFTPRFTHPASWLDAYEPEHYTFVFLLRILLPSPHKFARTSNKLLSLRESIHESQVMYNTYGLRSSGMLCGVGLFVNASQERECLKYSSEEINISNRPY